MNELFVFAVPPVCDAGFEDFRREMGRNKSIRSIQFSNQVEGRVFRMLDSFFSNNTNLTKFVVEECELDFDRARQLSLLLFRLYYTIHLTINRKDQTLFYNSALCLSYEVFDDAME